MRFSTEVLCAAVVAAVAGWISRAPADSLDRAAYLCTPVIAVSNAITRLGSALGDDGRVAPPVLPWRAEPARECERVLARVFPDSAP